MGEVLWGWAGREGVEELEKADGELGKGKESTGSIEKEGEDLHLSGRDAWRRWERQWASRAPGGKGGRMADGRGFGTPGPPAARGEGICVPPLGASCAARLSQKSCSFGREGSLP